MPVFGGQHEALSNLPSPVWRTSSAVCSQCPWLKWILHQVHKVGYFGQCQRPAQQKTSCKPRVQDIPIPARVPSVTGHPVSCQLVQGSSQSRSLEPTAAIQSSQFFLLPSGGKNANLISSQVKENKWGDKATGSALAIHTRDRKLLASAWRCVQLAIYI